LGQDSLSGLGSITAVLLPGVSSPPGIVLTGGSPTLGSAAGTGGSQSNGPVLLSGSGSGTSSTPSGAGSSSTPNGPVLFGGTGSGTGSSTSTTGSSPDPNSPVLLSQYTGGSNAGTQGTGTNNGGTLSGSDLWLLYGAGLGAGSSSSGASGGSSSNLLTLLSQYQKGSNVGGQGNGTGGTLSNADLWGMYWSGAGAGSSSSGSDNGSLADDPTISSQYTGGSGIGRITPLVYNPESDGPPVFHSGVFTGDHGSVQFVQTADTGNQGTGEGDRSQSDDKSRARYWWGIQGWFLGDEPIDDGGSQVVQTGDTGSVQAGSGPSTSGSRGWIDAVGDTALGIGSYVGRSAKSLILGDWTDEKPTGLSIGTGIGLGVIGVDLPMDLRDLGHTVTHPELSYKWGQTLAFNTIGLFPLIGVIKNAKNLKYLDDAGELAKRSEDAADAAGDAGRRVPPPSNEPADLPSTLPSKTPSDPPPKVPSDQPSDAPTPSRPLGARGPASGREYDPSNAGGPIRPLTTDGIRITDRGIDYAERHLSRFGPDPANEGMIQRLRDIAAGKLEPTQADLNFYSHELRESMRYKSLGFPSGQPLDEDAAYDLWNNAHTATLEDYLLKERRGVLYHPSVEP
ncbi:MAG: hypothetical protein RLZZ326_2569, partial [Planctomycetota bacterium]